jgi:pyruvate formate-lyase activating enzyme-like uncharacterized protein
LIYIINDQLSELEQILSYIENAAAIGQKYLNINNIEYPENVRYLQSLGYSVIISDSKSFGYKLSWETV